MSLKINLPGKEQSGISLEELLLLRESPTIPLNIVAKLTPEDKEKFWTMMIQKDPQKVYWAGTSLKDKKLVERVAVVALETVPKIAYWAGRYLCNKEIMKKAGWKLLGKNEPESYMAGILCGDQELFQKAREELFTNPERAYETAAGYDYEFHRDKYPEAERWTLANAIPMDDMQPEIDDEDFLDDARTAWAEHDPESALENGKDNMDKELVKKAGWELIAKDPKLAYHAGVFSGDKDLAEQGLTQYAKMSKVDNRFIEALYEDED